MIRESKLLLRPIMQARSAEVTESLKKNGKEAGWECYSFYLREEFLSSKANQRWKIIAPLQPL